MSARGITERFLLKMLDDETVYWRVNTRDWQNPQIWQFSFCCSANFSACQPVNHLYSNTLSIAIYASQQISRDKVPSCSWQKSPMSQWSESGRCPLWRRTAPSHRLQLNSPAAAAAPERGMRIITGLSVSPKSKNKRLLIAENLNRRALGPYALANWH